MSTEIQTSSRLPFRADGRLSSGRAPLEFYPTPPAATRALISIETFDGPIWEPACGKGAISEELIEAGYDVVSTDLGDYHYGESGINFLTQPASRAKHIVTNPPYGRGLGDRFVRHALKLTVETGGSVAMLLNIASLCHPDRHLSFLRRPPRTIYALDECICWPNGDPQQATRLTRNHRYCWLVWDATATATQSTEMRWLSTAPFETGGASWQ